jgi:hypothetical protein
MECNDPICSPVPIRPVRRPVPLTDLPSLTVNLLQRFPRGRHTAASCCGWQRKHAIRQRPPQNRMGNDCRNVKSRELTLTSSAFPGCLYALAESAPSDPVSAYSGPQGGLGLGKMERISGPQRSRRRFAIIALQPNCRATKQRQGFLPVQQPRSRPYHLVGFEMQYHGRRSRCNERFRRTGTHAWSRRPTGGDDALSWRQRDNPADATVGL